MAGLMERPPIVSENRTMIGAQPHEPWQILSSRVIYSAKPWIELSVQQVQLPGGRIIEDYHQIRLPEYCVVYAETTDGKVVATRQYRHGSRAVGLALPAGFVEEGEAPLEAAKRELVEETGFRADGWEMLGSFTPNSNYGCGRAHLFTAKNAVRVAAPDSGDLEVAEITLMDPDAVLNALHTGEVHSLSMAAIIALASTKHR